MAVNRSETFVQALCERSFLTLWTHSNPLGKGGKELCDALVVCHPDILIVSVKEVEFKGPPEDITAWSRWSRRAVDASVKQIYGAERFLRGQSTVRTLDGEMVALPDPSDRRVFRVAVALGGDRSVPIASGDFGNGVVHVLDELSTPIVLNELDTISDLVAFLADTETLLEKTQVLVNGGVEDLVAVYLHHGRKFTSQPDFLMIEPDTWAEFSSKPEYTRKNEADVSSRLWDRLIESLSQDLLEGQLEHGSRKTTEQVLRVMARENRFSRRILGKSLDEFLKKSTTTRARITDSPSGVRYVFLARSDGTSREERINELKARCYVARHLADRECRVVGIATEQYVPGSGHSLDVLLCDFQWTDKHGAIAERIRKECDVFDNPQTSVAHEDEYPDA